MRRVKQLQKMIGSKTADGNHCLTIADRVQSALNVSLIRSRLSPPVTNVGKKQKLQFSQRLGIHFDFTALPRYLVLIVT